MLRTTLILVAVLLGSTSAFAANNCKVFGGNNNDYSILAVGSLSELSTYCDESRVSNCTLTCTRASNVSCKGYVGNHPELMEVFATGDSFAEVQATCAAANKKCDIVCGDYSNPGDHDHGAGGPGDR